MSSLVKPNYLRVPLIAVCCVMLVACPGGSDDPIIAPSPDRSPAGVWAGSIALNGATARTVVALIAEDGRFAAVVNRSAPAVADGRAMVGTGTVSGSQLNSSGAAYSSVAFPSGATGVTFTVTGTVTERTSINGTYTGGGETGPLTLTFDAATYDRASSFAVLGGVYASSSTTVPTGTMTISSGGAITYNTASCVGNGTVTLLNPTKNLYSWTMTVSALSGMVCGNPGAFSGLATLGDAATGGTNNTVVMIGARDGAGLTSGFSFIGTK